MFHGKRSSSVIQDCHFDPQTASIAWPYHAKVGAAEFCQEPGRFYSANSFFETLNFQNALFFETNTAFF